MVCEEPLAWHVHGDIRKESEGEQHYRGMDGCVHEGTRPSLCRRTLAVACAQVKNDGFSFTSQQILASDSREAQTLMLSTSPIPSSQRCLQKLFKPGGSKHFMINSLSVVGQFGFWSLPSKPQMHFNFNLSQLICTHDWTRTRLHLWDFSMWSPVFSRRWGTAEG